MKTQVNKMKQFESVADTLFIPLTARIYVSRRFPEYFYDARALELAHVLPNDSIEKKSSEYAMLASVARCQNLDEMTKKFISVHAKCNIVNLGCGLETAYDRINSKTALFYEVDLPAVIERRMQFLQEGKNEKLIAGDLFDLSWVNQIADCTRPTLLIASGVFQYFHEEEILTFIKKCSTVFPQAELIFDAANKTGIRYANQYVRKTGNHAAMMYFYVNDCMLFAEKAEAQLIEWRPFYTKTRKIIGSKTGLYTRIAMKVCDDLARAKLIHLKLSDLTK